MGRQRDLRLWAAVGRHRTIEVTWEVQMYDRILIPVDGSEPSTTALKAGERLAARWDADITVLTLLSRSDAGLGLSETFNGEAERIRRHRSVEIRSLSYSVPDDIAAEFDAVDNTLVVMSTRARGRSAALSGNVAENVLRLVRHPVVLLGPSVEVADDWPNGPLLVCTDGSDFADSISPLAASWSLELDLEVTVVGVIDPAKVPAGISTPSESSALVRVAHDMEHRTGREINFDTLHGSHPAEAVADYANRYGSAMIALATHGRKGVERILRGSVAMDIVREAACPVLLDRPPTDSRR